MANPVIVMSGLGKRYGHPWVFSGVDLVIHVASVWVESWRRVHTFIRIGNKQYPQE